MSWHASELRSALGDARVVVRENVVLSPLTHVRIGGPAQALLEPFNEEAAAIAVRACRELEIPLFVLGGGSNVIVADDDGVVVVAREAATRTLAAARERQANESGKRAQLAAGALSLDIYGMRKKLEAAGFRYVETLADLDGE